MAANETISRTRLGRTRLFHYSQFFAFFASLTTATGGSASFRVRQKDKTILKSPGSNQYKTQWASGADLIAQRYELLKPGETRVIGTALYIEDFTIFEEQNMVPEIQIRPRSSLSKKGISCSLGTVDIDYRQEIGAILTNQTEFNFEIYSGDRIAQIVCGVAYRSPSITIANTKRQGGFGSTN